MVICLERGADLNTAQLMLVPLTVCCFRKIQIGFTFLVPAHPGSPGKRAVKRVCVCMCVCVCYRCCQLAHIDQRDSAELLKIGIVPFLPLRCSLDAEERHDAVVKEICRRC